MRYSEAKQGRVFVLRLEDGEILHQEVEQFARQHGIRAATVVAVGGADQGSTLVVGPEQARADRTVAMEQVLDHVHEVAAVGTVFPDEDGEPILHMHAACGRQDRALVGCVRTGVRVWHVLEVVLTELVDCTARRSMEDPPGFKLLCP